MFERKACSRPVQAIARRGISTGSDAALVADMVHLLWEADVLVYKAHITTSPDGRVADLFWIHDHRGELPKTHRSILPAITPRLVFSHSPGLVISQISPCAGLIDMLTCAVISAPQSAPICVFRFYRGIMLD